MRLKIVRMNMTQFYLLCNFLTKCYIRKNKAKKPCCILWRARLPSPDFRRSMPSWERGTIFVSRTSAAGYRERRRSYRRYAGITCSRQGTPPNSRLKTLLGNQISLMPAYSLDVIATYPAQASLGQSVQKPRCCCRQSNRNQGRIFPQRAQTHRR